MLDMIRKCGDTGKVSVQNNDVIVRDKAETICDSFRILTAAVVFARFLTQPQAVLRHFNADACVFRIVIFTPHKFAVFCQRKQFHKALPLLLF